MVNRLKKNQEKKVSKSFCIEESIHNDFQDNCANLDISASKQQRKMIIKFNEECNEKNKNKKGDKSENE